MKLEVLINSLLKSYQLDMIKPEENGSYKLFFDNKYKLNFKQVDDRLYIKAIPGTLDHLTSLKKIDLLVDLLHFNFARFYTQKEVLCLENNEKDIVLYRKFTISNLSASSFEQAVEDFVNSLSYWQDKLSNPPAQIHQQQIEDLMANPINNILYP